MATIEARISKRRTSDGKTIQETHYRAKVRMKGSPSLSATFPRKTDAHKWAQQTEAAIREGRYFKNSEAKRHTVSELITRYEAEIFPQKAKGTIITQKHELAWWNEKIGDRLLSEVTPALISDLKTQIKNENDKVRSDSTVKHYLAPLSHAFTVAMKEWHWLEENPIQKVSRPRSPRGRDRYLSDEEREKLLAACRRSGSHLLYPIVVVALSTGARKSEILGLKWNDFDVVRSRIILRKTKNGDPRTVPLTGFAYELISELTKVRRLDSDWIFPSPDGKRPIDIRSAWEGALSKSKVEGFRFHDLRHSCASYLAMNGATLVEISEILGHKTLAMVKRYAHISEQHSSKVLLRMNTQIFNMEGRRNESA